MGYPSISIDCSCVHYLSGPVEIEGAHPGDVLIVEILDVQPFASQPWGFTGVFHERNGGGFLDQHYPLAAKAIWDFEGIFASSRHIPGVRFPGLIHPGLMGCAPSHELLAIWNKRESGLVEVFPVRYEANDRNSKRAERRQSRRNSLKLKALILDKQQEA